MTRWNMPFDLKTIITSITTTTTGSVQFSTGAKENPWDKPGDDGVAPSGRIAGDGMAETPARRAATSED